jgi:hypothetical protein
MLWIMRSPGKGMRVKPPATRQGLPGNVDMITRSALLPAISLRRDSQGGASSRLAREGIEVGNSER